DGIRDRNGTGVQTCALPISKLADAWRQATRGMGMLTVVPESADIVVNVVPARGTSGHWRAADGTERVLIYVVDERGRPWTEGGIDRKSVGEGRVGGRTSGGV